MGQTETKVAQVTLKSENDRSKTVSIDRPKDNLTLNQIKTAFQPAISGGWLLDNYGDRIVEVSEAKYNQVIKTTINGEPVVVSPASVSFDIGSNTTVGSYVETTVTATNATILTAAVNDISAASVALNVSLQGSSAVRIRAFRNSTGYANFVCHLKLIFQDNATVTVPITVTMREIS